MKTLLVGSLTLAAAALTGAPGTATGQSAGTDSVTGAAADCIEAAAPPLPPGCRRTLSLDVRVQSGPAGENPSGVVTWSDAGPSPSSSSSASTQATCLSVSGRVAIIGVTGFLRFPTLPVEPPIAGLIRIVDVGGLNSGADTFEFAIQTGDEFGPPLPGPTSCSTFPGTFPTGSFSFTNETGDFVVVDAQLNPTSKQQCKNGGWRTFGVFKNQGDCVSFVATRGKNPPGGSP